METTTVTHSESNDIIVSSLLGKAFTQINRERVESYRQAESFLRQLGIPYSKVVYNTSYVSNGKFVDIYRYQKGGIIIYVSLDSVVGFKVKPVSYGMLNYVKNTIRGYSLYETSGSLVGVRY